MKSKRHTTEQIIAELRRADVELGKGHKVLDICKLLSITEQTYYHWRQKYGGMPPEMAKELRALVELATAIQWRCVLRRFDNQAIGEFCDITPAI